METKAVFKNMNSVRQGTVGVGAAIFEFCKKDWCVSIPINDTQPYDLIVDMGSGPKRVQVKTTGYIRNNNYVVQLKSVRPNRTKNIIRKFCSNDIDYLFILCDNNTKYMIPCDKIKSVSAVSLNSDWNVYKI